MALDKISDKVVETDLLVIGGGIAGCPVAAKAAEHGLNVTIVEKSKTERSGSAGPGCDHIGAYPRGVTAFEAARRYFEGPTGRRAGRGRFADPNMYYNIYSHAWWALEELEKLPVTMKWHDDDYYWIAHAKREQSGTLRVHWQNVKPQMAAAVRKRGVNVLERTMVIDLLTNRGKVVGATAVNTRTGEFIVIKAKAVVTATGMFARAYDPWTPSSWKYKYRYHWCPAAVSGDGMAMAYRAGAELANFDTGAMPMVADDLTLSFGNFRVGDGCPGKIFNWRGEGLTWPQIYSTSVHAEQEQKGLTPLYHSLEHLPDDFHKRMEIAFVDERMLSLKIAEERGFNPRITRYPIMGNIQMPAQAQSGVLTDEDFKTSLKGLYVVGDAVAGFHSCILATTSGFIVGENIDRYVSEAGEPVVEEAQVESQKRTYLAPLAVNDGTEPVELESAVRYVCMRYVGHFISEGKLREGLRRLGTLRRVFLPKLMARNPHHLMRCLEVRNIIDLAETHINACLERTETRGSYIRLDYPELDSSRDNMITVQRLENGKAVVEIREVPDWKPEYAKEGK